MTHIWQGLQSGQWLTGARARGYSLILPLLPYYARTFNANQTVTGLLLASYSIMQLIGAPILGRLSDRFGRKLVLGGRVDEEVESVADVLGRGVAVTGFYSYGEIGPIAGSGSPIAGSGECKLHNQTMTVTVISES